MAFTQAQLDAIEEAIASGAMKVKYADKEVTYQSMSDLLRARDTIRRALGITTGASSRVYPTVSKNLDYDTED